MILLYLQIGLLARDQGEPNSQVSVPALLRLTVDRNDFTPELLNLPNTIVVEENAVVNGPIGFTIQKRDNDTRVSFHPFTPTPLQTNLVHSMIHCS